MEIRIIDEILDKYDDRDIEIAIKLEYGTVTEFAKRVGVSRRMINKYIYEYLLNGAIPKWSRKKTQGAFGRFLLSLKKALEKEERFIEQLAKEEGLDKEVTKRIVFKCMEVIRDA